MKRYILFILLMLTSTFYLKATGTIEYSVPIDELQRCCGLDLDGDLIIIVYDINGQEVGRTSIKKDQFNNYKVSINSDNVSSGLYIVTVTDSKSGNSFSDKIII